MSNQLSPEWFAERRGKATASRVADLMARTKAGYSTSRANYMAQLIAERLTGVTAESYINTAMQWGSDHEQEARDAYQFYFDVEVEPAQFVPHPRIENFGGSPDGLVGTNGLIQIKAPNTKTHIDYLLKASIPGEYRIQMQSELACTCRQWSDFVSYDPRMPEALRLFVQRLHRDGVVIYEIETEVQKFLVELEAKIQELLSLHQYEPTQWQKSVELLKEEA